MSIEIKISKKRISYKTAMLYLNKRVEEVKIAKNRESIVDLRTSYYIYSWCEFQQKRNNR